MIKQDYYEAHGLSDSSPPVRELLEALPSILKPSVELHKLRKHLPPIEGPIYDRLMQVPNRSGPST